MKISRTLVFWTIIVVMAMLIMVLTVSYKHSSNVPLKGPILDFLCKNTVNNAVNNANIRCNNEKNAITSNLNNLQTRISNIENNYVPKSGGTFTGDVQVPFLLAKSGIKSEGDILFKDVTGTTNYLSNLSYKVSSIDNDYVRRTGDTFTGDVEVPFLVAKSGIRSDGNISVKNLNGVYRIL